MSTNQRDYHSNINEPTSVPQFSSASGNYRRELSNDQSVDLTEIDENDVTTVEAVHVPSGRSTCITYGNVKSFGTGSFGVVYCATLFADREDGQEVAIKKVLQDPRYKNRELQILKEMRHINIVALFYYFYSHSNSTNSHETYLNLVQEFVPQTLSRLIKHYYRIRQIIPLAYVKLYSFQLLRGLAYVHHLRVCHRDIKPQNLLINPEQGTLKICDFGSAKILDPSEPNVSYICSRYYRAPELIFGATQYTVLIDMWSAGCVIGELLLGRPLFPGGSGVDQLVEIIKILGTPTPEQVLVMNPNYKEFKFPHIAGCPWEKVIRHRTNDAAFSVLRRLLVYEPEQRATASDILADPFFADLIFPPPGHPPNATGRLPSGRPAPQFPMEFTDEELNYLPAELVNRIRSCQRAVVEAETTSITETSSTNGDGTHTPTNNKSTVRLRISHPSEDSTNSIRARRPISSGYVSRLGGTSRTRSLLVTTTTSAADVRPALKPANDGVSTEGSVVRRHKDRSVSQSVLIDQHAGTSAPLDGPSRRITRNGKVNRYSFYAETSKR